jgi:uncharacterized protein YjiK
MIARPGARPRWGGRPWRASLLLSVLPVASSAPQEPGLLDRCHYAAVPEARAVLPHLLREISGLALVPPDRILTHDDERGRVYQLDLRTGRVGATWPLAGEPPGDYEGIATLRDSLYLLSSDGVLLRMPLPTGSGALPWSRQKTGLGHQCELEGLVSLEREGVLLMPCKVFRRGAHGTGLRIYRWDPAAEGLAVPPAIDVTGKDLKRATGWKSFPASAIEVDPRSGHLLVLSGRARALVELTPDGTVVGSRVLDRRYHRQPEGLALAPGDALFVSDEAAGLRATLSRYDCHP